MKTLKALQMTAWFALAVVGSAGTINTAHSGTNRCEREAAAGRDEARDVSALRSSERNRTGNDDSSMSYTSQSRASSARSRTRE